MGASVTRLSIGLILVALFGAGCQTGRDVAPPEPVRMPARVAAVEVATVADGVDAVSVAAYESAMALLDRDQPGLTHYRADLDKLRAEISMLLGWGPLTGERLASAVRRSPLEGLSIDPEAADVEVLARAVRAGIERSLARPGKIEDGDESGGD